MIESQADTTTKARSTATEYVVLEQVELKDADGNLLTAWIERGHATSPTRTGAATKVAEDRDGIWRPVPLRNWQQPIRTWHETFTKLKTGEVEEP